MAIIAAGYAVKVGAIDNAPVLALVLLLSLFAWLYLAFSAPTNPAAQRSAAMQHRFLTEEEIKAEGFGFDVIFAASDLTQLGKVSKESS